MRGGGSAAAFGGDRQEQVLGADVLVLQPGGLRFGRVVTWRSRADSDGCDPPCALGAAPSSARSAEATRRRIDVHLSQNLRNDAALLFDERQQQVLRRDLRMSFAVGQLLCGDDRFLCLLGVLVDVHGRLSDLSELV